MLALPWVYSAEEDDDEEGRDYKDTLHQPPAPVSWNKLAYLVKEEDACVLLSLLLLLLLLQGYRRVPRVRVYGTLVASSVYP